MPSLLLAVYFSIKETTTRLRTTGRELPFAVLNTKSAVLQISLKQYRSTPPRNTGFSRQETVYRADRARQCREPWILFSRECATLARTVGCNPISRKNRVRCEARRTYRPYALCIAGMRYCSLLRRRLRGCLGETRYPCLPLSKIKPRASSARAVIRDNPICYRQSGISANRFAPRRYLYWNYFAVARASPLGNGRRFDLHRE